MIKFLIERPIAVIMAFLACVIIGTITYTTLPISLLPSIAIPEITVQISGENKSARELENSVVKPIRSQLIQVAHLRDIRSETRDGFAIIKIKFDYGTNTDLAFIEVNEKIDASMNGIPKDVSRPRVIKASATDIPVFYLNISLKDDKAYEPTNEDNFLELSYLSDNVIKRRIEQLPEVSMADVTGLTHKQLVIVPDNNKIDAANISLNDISAALTNNNVEPGSMMVRDGYYEYNIKFSSMLRSIEDIRNIYIRKDDRLFQLKDLATVSLESQPETGLSMVNGKRCITMAVIKHSEETMENMKNSLDKTMKNLEQNYPFIEFSINRNQTELLDFTISNLKQNLSLGFLLVILVALLFLGDAKSPMVLCICMVSSLISSFIFFYLFGKSLNIISLSGMILALGMMIDSSIIVTDIITQYRMQGYSIKESCIKGANEVITPILSSTLTTIAVFIPLIFMSGIAGAIFFDQAFAVTVSLLVAYITGIILLPILYYLLYTTRFFKKDVSSLFRGSQETTDKYTFKWYDQGFNFVFHHKTLLLILTIASLPFCALLFIWVPKTGMPEIEQSETIINVDWNENIHVTENRDRVVDILKCIEELSKDNSCYIGQRQYILERDNKLSTSESKIYVKAEGKNEIDSVHTKIREWIHTHHPKTVISFSPPENVFEQIFETGEAVLITELSRVRKEDTVESEEIDDISKKIEDVTGEKSESVAYDEQFIINVDREKLLLYGIDYSTVRNIIRTAINDNKIGVLQSYQHYLPISISGKKQSINQVLHKTLIPVRDKDNVTSHIPLMSVLNVTKSKDLKTVVAGQNGEYIPLSYSSPGNPEEIVKKTNDYIKENKDWAVSFSGSFFSSKKMISELIIVLLVSIMLMYFILSSQFESFVQPLIVIAEIPVAVASALLCLWATGHTLNLMSAIGIVVTCGIVINDSILKIDMINELRKQGTPLMEAIHTAGVRRLRAIVMTSLTTIFAMVPLLFSNDMGSELQKPLAIAMIGAMVIGTLVSLYIIPIIYWIIYRKKSQQSVSNG